MSNSSTTYPNTSQYGFVLNSVTALPCYNAESPNSSSASVPHNLIYPNGDLIHADLTDSNDDHDQSKRHSAFDTSHTSANGPIASTSGSVCASSPLGTDIIFTSLEIANCSSATCNTETAHKIPAYVSSCEKSVQNIDDDYCTPKRAEARLSATCEQPFSGQQSLQMMQNTNYNNRSHSEANQSCSFSTPTMTSVPNTVFNEPVSHFGYGEVRDLATVTNSSQIVGTASASRIPAAAAQTTHGRLSMNH
jgi:hypothetical protein